MTLGCPLCGKPAESLKSIWIATTAGNDMKIPACSECEAKNDKR